VVVSTPVARLSWGYCDLDEEEARDGEPGETWATRTAVRSAGCFGS
jgi:hypothetical protein